MPASDARRHAVSPPHLTRLLAVVGALFAALAVGLSAYAAHAAAGDAREQLQMAALFAFGHGIALAALAPRAGRRWGLAALILLALGTLLFSGSLVARQAWGTPTTLAPFGGGLMIVAWLLHAVEAARH